MSTYNVESPLLENYTSEAYILSTFPGGKVHGKHSQTYIHFNNEGVVHTYIIPRV